MSLHATEALGIVLILKAFAAGCSAVTGVEAIANGVPAFKQPRVRTAQRTEFALGALLAVMLIGIATLIRVHDVAPRGGVTMLAQLTAGAFGTGWPFYVSNLAVTAVLGLAANTSFGGLPVLMSILARDHRLPHAFYLRAERPIYRIGIIVLAVAAALLLVAVGADTNRLIPLYAIGVFIGFTISQVGLVHHWRKERPSRWRARVALNGFGAILTAICVVVFLSTKFLEGAWVVVIAIPLMMWLFSHTETYYAKVARRAEARQDAGDPAREGERRHRADVDGKRAHQGGPRRGSVDRRHGGRGGGGGRRGGTGARQAATGINGSARCRSRSLIDPHRSLVRTVYQVRRHRSRRTT